MFVRVSTRFSQIPTRTIQTLNLVEKRTCWRRRLETPFFQAVLHLQLHFLTQDSGYRLNMG